MLKVGTRWCSAVCSTEVIVVRSPSADVALECGGQPMVPAGAPRREAAASDTLDGPGSQIGKRYADDALGLEVLCTKGGAGALAVGGASLVMKGAKHLPSSD